MNKPCTISALNFQLECNSSSKRDSKYINSQNISLYFRINVIIKNKLTVQKLAIMSLNIFSGNDIF